VKKCWRLELECSVFEPSYIVSLAFKIENIILLLRKSFFETILLSFTKVILTMSTPQLLQQIPS